MLLELLMGILCTSAARVFSQSRSAELSYVSYTQLQLSPQLFSGQRLAACFSQSHRHSAELSHTQLQLSSQRGGSGWRLAAGFWFLVLALACSLQSRSAELSYTPIQLQPNSTEFDCVRWSCQLSKTCACACSGQRLAVGWLFGMSLSLSAELSSTEFD